MMELTTVNVNLTLFLATIVSFVYGNTIVDRGYIGHVGSRKLRAKRHVVFDNEKLCKAVGCVNGYCKESELRKYRIVCECFIGYEGTLCDKLKCPNDCGKHGACARKGQILYCKCAEGYYGANCNSYLKPHSKLSATIAPKSLLKALGSALLSSAPEYKNSNAVIVSKNSWLDNNSNVQKQVKFTDFHSHAEIDTSVKADVCAPGFQCYHGHCDREAISDGYFRCVCKPNYTGLFCEKRCTLKCQNGGTCLVFNDGHQVCSCPFSFNGHYCEKRI